MQYRKIAMLACVLAIASGAAFAGINSKEVGAVLIYPTYQAYDGESNIDTYISITNDKNLPIVAHFEIIGDVVCDDCSFDLLLTPYQTKRLLLDRQTIGGNGLTRVYDASGHSETGDVVSLTACSEPEGFIVVTTEDPNQIDAYTLGENVLHGDLVIVDLRDGTSSQMGAIAVQAVGSNDGNRWIEFDGLEYAKFPNIVTANFWSPNDSVEPRLVLFNVDFETGDIPPDTHECEINYVNAEEDRFNADYNMDCYARVNLRDLAPGFIEDILGTANGFLWAQCDEGTHGAMITDLEDPTSNYLYPDDSQHADTLFQSVTTTRRDAKLKLTKFVQNEEPTKQ
jgi:hypothetical protein